MQRYRIVIMMVLFGLVPVIAAFFVALSFLEEEAPVVETPPVAEAPPPSPAPPPPPPPPVYYVFVAARALPAGTLLGEGDLNVQEINKEEIGEYVAVEKPTDENKQKESGKALRGYAVRETLAAGERLTGSAVVGPGQRGFLATVLKPGMLAVTINVGTATSYVGLLDPGDRVDVILTAALPGTGTPGGLVARTILEDVRVVAIDQWTGGGTGWSGSRASKSGPDESIEGIEHEEIVRSQIVTATLEVSPEQGNRLVLGGREGMLSLAVRSSLAAASAPQPSRAAVALHELLLPSGIPSGIERKAVRIFRGSEPAEAVSFSTAAQ